MSREVPVRGDEDFAAYADARWPVLVAALEAEGVAPDAARLAVAEVLLGRRRGWERLVRDEDVDAGVWHDLRERTGLPRRPGERPPLEIAPPGSGEPDPLQPWLSRAADVRRGNRWRTARRSLATLAVACLVLAGLAWWDMRPDPPEVREEANPLPVVWYADGELHLAEVVVELTGVDAFVAVGDGAAVRRDSGEVLRVDGSGGVSADQDPPAQLEAPPPEPDQVAFGPLDVVVHGAPVPGGGWAYVLHSGRADRDELRISDAGRRMVVVCDTSQPCREVDTGLASAAGVRLR